MPGQRAWYRANHPCRTTPNARAPQRAGGFDIWRVRRNSVSTPFGEPAHVPQLSTRGQEWGVTISPDGSTALVVSGDSRGNVYTSQFAVGGAPVDGEMDCDGDVDLNDFSELVSCLTGPDSTVSIDCDLANSDGDGDSDLHDYLIFSSALSTAP